MILDSDQVHLLRPISEMAQLTGGRTAETIAAEIDEGTISPESGRIVIDFYQADPVTMDRNSTQLLERYNKVGIQIRGIFAAEPAENDFPRLPVIHSPGEMVVICAYENEAFHHQQASSVANSMELFKARASLMLTPTLRSPLRW